MFPSRNYKLCFRQKLFKCNIYNFKLCNVFNFLNEYPQSLFTWMRKINVNTLQPLYNTVHYNTVLDIT